jgi:hypothetical protein
MTIFAVLLPVPQSAVAEAIKRAFPNDHLPINDTQWLISAVGTAIDVTAKIGVVEPGNPQGPHTGNALVFATSGYYGRGPTNIWEWIKTKLEASPSG